MRQNLINRFVDDENQVDALEEFAPKVREILRNYRTERKLSFIAKQLGIHSSRLTEMITKYGNGEYRRRISPYYLAKFIDGGVMSVEEVLDGRRLEDLPERVRLFFERMILPRETILLVSEAQRRGINVDRILHEILNPDPKS